MRNKTLLLTAIALVLGIALASCKKDDPTTVTPTLVSETKNVHSTYAEFEWSIDFPGSYQSGVELSLHQNMSDSTLYQGSQSGNHFKVNIEDLTPNTNYYYRIVVWNPARRDVFAVSGFKTEAGVPVLSTDDPTDVTQTTAILGGEITHNGGIAPTSRGVCWSTSPEPTVDDAHMEVDVTSDHFTVNVSGLTPETKYYVRAYATNRAGTGYGNEVTFFTGDILLPQVTTVEVKEVELTAAVGVGKVTDDGGGDIIDRGFCWSTSHEPSISGSHVSTDTGTGLGSFTADLTGLTAGTTYYVRAYARNQVGIAYGIEMSFETKSPEKPTVATVSVTSITHQSAQGKGKVVSDGGAAVTERGICWSTSHNPDINGSHVSSGTGTGSFTCFINNLEPETQYYVRAYAKNQAGIGYGNEVSFTTFYEGLASVTTNSVSDVGSSTAKCEGNVIYDGNYTVTDRGICWSTSHNPDISGNHISSGNDIGLFTCTITGLEPETQYYVRAYATNSAGTNYGDELTFTTGSIPVGTIKGLFSVSSTEQVYFSKGNLQYLGGSNTWKFADHQWDVIGTSQGNSSQNTARDLFGWGTSGWDSGNTYYHPYDTYYSNTSLYGPPGNYNLTGDYANADWGVYNAISNGGNQAGLWRTLTTEEWVYLFNTREGASLNGVANARHAKAEVNGMAGVILFPDNYTHPRVVPEPNNINDFGASFTSNNYSGDDWNQMEQHGAVFLPAAGHREGTSVSYVGSYGLYWSTSHCTYYNQNYAFIAYFNDSSLNPQNYSGRDDARSVRLVRTAH